MEQALIVFINGITGVFSVMFVLYVTIRLMSVITDRLQRKPGPGER